MDIKLRHLPRGPMVNMISSLDHFRHYKTHHYLLNNSVEVGRSGTHSVDQEFTG